MPNLRELAESDLAQTLEDGASGFGWDITINDGDNPAETVKGQYHRVGMVYDPETQALISADKSTVTVRLSSLTNDIAKNDSLVTVLDITGESNVFTVADVIKDRTLGIVTLILMGKRK